MKPLLFSIGILLMTTLFSCEKNNSEINEVSCNLPATPVPDYLTGNRANGYNSSTEIVDAYTGEYIGNGFQSGKYFHFNADGEYAELYYMANAIGLFRYCYNLLFANCFE